MTTPMPPDKWKTLAHLRPYDGGPEYGSWRINTCGHATKPEEWHHLFAKAPLNPTDAHQAACHDSAATLRTAAMLKHPLLTSAGELNDNPTDAQLKAHQEPIMQMWQDRFAEFIESKVTGKPLTLVRNISTTDPNRGSEALSRLDAVYGHLAARDDNTDQEALFTAAIVRLHQLMTNASTTWGIASLIETLEAYFLASVSLGNTGELHDKSTLLIAKVILEKCPDTRHTVAFPTDTFDLKFKTVPTLLAEMRQHARRAPDRTAPGQENYSAALAITTPPPPPPSRTTFQNDGTVECKQCGKRVKDISFHLYSMHFDALKERTQQHLSTKHGSTPPSQHSGTNNVLAVTTGDLGASGGASPSMYETAVAYEAAGLPSFLWEGKVVNINHNQ